MKNFIMIFLLAIALLASVSSAQAQTDINDAKYAITTLVPAPLKICSVAGPGVLVGMPFTYTTTTSVEGTSDVFTSN